MSDTSSAYNLLISFGEELKIPLLQILRNAELGIAENNSKDNYQLIINSTRGAMTILDSYALAGQLLSGQKALKLESVSASSIAYDVTSELSDLARMYNTSIFAHTDKKVGLVTTDRRVLKGILASLAYTFMSVNGKEKYLDIYVKKENDVVVVGVYGDQVQVKPNTISRLTSLSGKVRQPLAGLSHSASAGILLAENLCLALGKDLIFGRHDTRRGFGVDLDVSQQLSLL